MISLTADQARLLRYIRGYQLAHGYSPMLREMGAALGYAKSRAHDLTVGLEERGAIRRIPHRVRAIEVIAPVSIPIGPDGAPLHSVPMPAGQAD